VTGRFVVLEGGDGSGKSTQVRRLAARLRGDGLHVVETREPGGTDLGAAVRALLLDGPDIDARAEALLMAADRAQHIAELVRPALEAGAWVLSDRHVASSLVYQGWVRGLGVDQVAALSRFAVDGLVPDLVLVLDVDDAVAEGRRSGDSDRLEREGAEFHRAIRAAYRELAAARGWVLVDGGADEATVEAAILGEVSRLGRS
jgi:dTMP kinase